MPRSFGITFAAAALLALAALTPHGALAAAHGGPGGGFHGAPSGFHGGPGGGGWGGHWGRHFYAPGVVGIPVPYFYYGPDYYYYGPEYYGPEVVGPACIRVLRHVYTRHGWRWRRVTICR